MSRTIAPWLSDAGILGMNSRNAEYIMAWNKRSAFPTVDDKVITKRLAAAYGIPTPELYLVIESHGDIKGFEDALGDRREFALKPARGSGGSGIVLVSGRTEEGFVKQSGVVIPKEEFVYHISDILAGIHSLEGLEDRAIIESLVHPAAIFEAVTYEGVPDIRIIAYRGVPAMAMVRLPTKASDGKANIHRGALGAGVDMGKWGPPSLRFHKSAIVTHHPDTGNPIAGIAIPAWREMLLVAAKGIDMTGLGYLGADMCDRPYPGTPHARNETPAPVSRYRWRTERASKGGSGLLTWPPGHILASPEKRVDWAMKTFGAGEPVGAGL